MLDLSKLSLSTSSSGLPKAQPSKKRVDLSGFQGIAQNVKPVTLGLDSPVRNYGTPFASPTNVAGFNIARYATDPTHEQKVHGIVNKIGKLRTSDEIGSYIKKVAPSSPVTGEMVRSAAFEYGVPPEMILAIMVQDSSLGTAGKAVRTRNPGNVGNTDSGAERTYKDWNSGVNAVAKWLSKNRAPVRRDGKGGAEGTGTALSFSRPVQTSLGNITTPFHGSTQTEKDHKGVDFANQIGTPIPAFVGGKVTSVTEGKKQGDEGFGNNVVIADGKGNKHRFSHLSNSYVKVGDKVPSGTIIGAMGNSGNSYSPSGGSGSHLDYRVKNIYGKHIDPMRFVKV